MIKKKKLCKHSSDYYWLVHKLTGKTRAQLINNPPNLSVKQKQQLQTWMHEITIMHKPLQYILGTVPFCEIEIRVRPPVLIPRPETEEWVGNLIQELANKQPLAICDVCTGSGCIALALAHALKKSTVIGCDIAPHALALAQENKKILQIKNVRFVKSNMLTSIKKRVDIIVANPPYVAPTDWHKLAKNIRRWEDKTALVAPERGYALIKQLITQAPQFFKKNRTGLLVIEIGSTQARAVCTLLKKHGYTEITVSRDLSGKSRVISATIKKESTYE